MATHLPSPNTAHHALVEHGTPLRLQRNIAAHLWWGTGGGIAAALMTVLLGASLVANVDFYLQGEPASIIVFCVFLVMLAVTVSWLTGFVELRDEQLVAGWRMRPQRIARDAVTGVRIGQVEPVADEIFGIQLLVDDEWTDLRLGTGLADETQMDWLKTLSRWADCDVIVLPLD